MSPLKNEFIVRIANKDDQPYVFKLIESVYKEFDYIASPAHGETDLLDLKTHYFDFGGCFWVAESNSDIIGSHAYLPTNSETGVCTFRRLYVHQDFRGTDVGRQLMQTTIDWAKEQGMRRVEFWSDTKYNRAHRFFEKLGSVRTDEIRKMHDGLQPYDEWFCYLDLM